MDLVEEFRSLDEIDDDIDVHRGLMRALSGAHDSLSMEQSIGGADLSGILAVDEEDEDAAIGFARDGREFSDAILALSPVRRRSSKHSGSVRTQGDPRGTEQAADSDDWDSDDGHVKNRTDVRAQTVGKSDPSRAKGSLETNGAVGRREKTSLPVPHDTAVLARGNTSRSWDEDSSNHANMLSPTRPAEEGSDWDDVAEKSSDDLEFLNSRMKPLHPYQNPAQSSAAHIPTGGNSQAGGTIRSPSRTSRSPALSRCETRTDRGKSCASRSSGRGRFHAHSQAPPSVISSPTPRTDNAEPSDGATMPNNKDRETLVPQRQTDPSQTKPASSLSQGGGESTGKFKELGKIEGQDSGPVAAQTSATEAGAEEAAAATIETLQAELCRLREHVLRSEQRREAQLRELEKRLKEQEKRNVVLAGEAALVAEGAGQAGKEKDDAAKSPQKTAGQKNPFATAVGGTETPREHFPAFEEAMQDRGEDATSQEVEDEQYESGGEKSALHHEAFEFSIDTLSHINNHTNFGIDVAVPSASVASPGMGRGDGGGATLRSNSAKRALGGKSCLKDDFPSVAAEEIGEHFDESDTAAEEAFFSDPQATASLQTPVKHMTGTAGSVAGVDTRRARLDGRSTHGVPAEEPVDESSRPRGSQPPQSTKSDRCDQGATNGSFAQVSYGLESAWPRPYGRGPVGLEQGELCVADFFARASAELEKTTSHDEDKRARTPVIVETATEAAEAARNKKYLRSPSPNKSHVLRVDAATQTAWTFAVPEQVRFVSGSVGTLKGDGRFSQQGRWARTWETGVLSTDKPNPSLSEELRGRLSSQHSETRVRRELRTFPSRIDNVRRAFSIPPCPSPPLWVAREGYSLEEGINKPSEGVNPIFMGSGCFDGPTLCPIADARKHPCRAASRSEGVFDTSAQKLTPREGDKKSLPCDGSARRQPNLMHERVLSPGARPGVPSASSTNGEAPPRFNPLAATEAEKTGCLLRDGTGKKYTKEGVDGFREDRRKMACSAGIPILKDAVGPASEGDPRCRDASVDFARSSLLMASTRASSTLETIAPLEEYSAGLSSLSHSRVGKCCPGELFADARLTSRAAEAPSRQSGSRPTRWGRLRPDDGVTLPPRLPREGLDRHRSRSAPTLPSELVENSLLGQEGFLPSSHAAASVPPAVVGAWLAAAIEGLYGYGYHDCGACNDTGNTADQRAERCTGEKLENWRRTGPREFDGAFREDVAFARSPTKNFRGSRTNASSQFKQSISVGIPAYAEGAEDSPPPPPPPSGVHYGLNGGNLDDGGEEADEEHLFYQRQHLLRRVVCAAATRGAVMPISARGVTAAGAANVSERSLPVEEERDARSLVKEDSLRRHSDPLSWKTYPGAATVPAGAGSSSASVAGGLAARGTTTSYMWRRTSGYWRDRLGMNQ